MGRSDETWGKTRLTCPLPPATPSTAIPPHPSCPIFIVARDITVTGCTPSSTLHPPSSPHVLGCARRSASLKGGRRRRYAHAVSRSPPASASAANPPCAYSTTENALPPPPSVGRGVRVGAAVRLCTFESITVTCSSISRAARQKCTVPLHLERPPLSSPPLRDTHIPIRQEE